MQQQPTESKKNAAPPVVPARNDPDEAPVDFSAMATELDNKDPNCVYQFVSTKPNHPQYIGKYLVPRRIETTDADGKPGQPVWMRPWVTVTRDSDPVLEQGLVRADQGVPIDNKIRNGTQVLIKTTKANAALATAAHDAEVAANARALRLPQQTRLAGGITVRTGLTRGDADENELRDLVEKKGPR